MQHADDPTVHRARLRTALPAILKELASSDLPVDQQVARSTGPIREVLQASWAEVDVLAHSKLVCYGSAGPAVRTAGSIAELDDLWARVVASGC